MTIRGTHPEADGSRGTTPPLLEVIALGPADAVAAEAGGADRIEVVASMEADGLSPDLATIEAIRRRTSVPMRVMLRAGEGFTTTPAELARLRGAAREYADAGADGFVLGFLTPTLEIDLAATTLLAQSLAGLPWTFHRAVDHVLDPDKAWWELRDLPGLTSVLTAGSPRGVDAGVNDLIRRARSDPFAAARTMAGGGLRAEQVPWLAQSGIRAFHVGSGVRPDGSWKAYVDAGYVRSWRTLIDEEVSRADDFGTSGTSGASGTER